LRFATKRHKERFVLRAFVSTFASSHRGQVDKTDGIQLALERKGGDAVDVFVPYAELPDGKFTYGELFVCERIPTLFVHRQQRI